VYPNGIRQLAWAAFFQAARDLRDPRYASNARSWLVRGGRLGDSDWYVREILEIESTAGFLAGAVKLAQNPKFINARTVEQAMAIVEGVDHGDVR
jgi:hypothetical protein